MARNDRWPTRCTLMGCTGPSVPGHHHHYNGGHLRTAWCTCTELGEPGTRPSGDPA